MDGFEYVYANGCRSPPWRQLHGDICYLVAKPHDGDFLFITASTDGFFINGGPLENEPLSFDRTSEPVDKLVSLLRGKTPHFGQVMDKLVSFYLICVVTFQNLFVVENSFSLGKPQVIQ